MNNACGNLVENPDVETLLARTGSRTEDNIKTDLSMWTRLK
jgi:hypothetical protein